MFASHNHLEVLYLENDQMGEKLHETFPNIVRLNFMDRNKKPGDLYEILPRTNDSELIDRFLVC
jgi:hypothetical protein